MSRVRRLNCGINKIYVEANTLKNDLNSLNLTNVQKINNFRKIENFKKN